MTLLRATSALIASALLTAPGLARAVVSSIEVSPDITVSVGGVVLGPGGVGNDNLAGVVSFSGVGVAIPAGVSIDAFDRLPGGVDALFSVDIPANIGGVFVAPDDVVRVTGGAVSIAWSGRTAGLPAGADIDAIARMPDASLLLSFDTTVALGGITADDEDVVRIAPNGAVSLFFDGSARGIASAIDLDGLDHTIDGRLLLSFDISGSVGGVNFDDEDVLVFNPANSSFAMSYDGSTQHAAWLAGDLDALDGSLDPDGDGIFDAGDLCPFFAQTNNLDTDLDFRGNQCECTDQNGDGRNTVSDLVAINQAIFNPAQITPLCDGNNDNLCTVSDIVAANVEIFSPTNTSTCARQPFPGP